MEASSTVVMKVKYGDVLRRFNATIADGKPFLNMAELREKIISLFSFTPVTDLMLTYVDEDGDGVALVDDDDLRDVVKQGLNPIRVTVKVNHDKNGDENYSVASSTPSRSPHVQRLPTLTAGVSEILREVPEPLRATLLKLSDDLADKAFLSSPIIAELVENLSKVSSSFLGQQLSESGVSLNMQNDVPKSSSVKQTKASEPLEVDPAAKLEKFKSAAKMERKEAKIQNVTGKKEGPHFDFSAVASALESQNVIISKPESDGVSHTVRGKDKVKKICGTSTSLSSQVDNKLTGNDNSTTEPKFGSNSRSDGSSYPMNGDNVIDITTSGLNDDFENPPVQNWSPNNGDSKFCSLRGTGSIYECPFSSTLKNMSAVLPHCPSDAIPSRSSNSQNDTSDSVFHHGFRCDGCGIHPIVGPRFNSKVKVDYDLCCICFEKMGNVNDYIRMDCPALYQHHLPHFRAREHPHVYKGSNVYRGSKGKLGAVKLDSRFVQDVNIFDGTVMAPLTPFTKIWRMRNNGTVAWPQKTQLVWIGGDKLTDTHSVEVQIPAAGLQMDQELDVAIDFISPKLPGRYMSYWRMASPSGPKFGQRVWVLIQVDASNNGTPHDSVRNLNLNLPPSSSSLTCPEIINIDPAAVVDAHRPKAGNSKTVVESGLATTDELKFPINDILLVGNEAGSSSAAPSSSSVSYPIIDLSDVPTLPSISLSIPLSMQHPLVPLPVSVQPPPPPTVSVQPPSPPTVSVQPPPRPTSFVQPPPYPTFSVQPPNPPTVSVQPPPPPTVSVQSPPPTVSVQPPPPPTVSVQQPPSTVSVQQPPSTVSVQPPLPVLVSSPAMLIPMSPPPPPTAPVGWEPEPANGVPEKDLIEDRLLRELEEMGFKQVDLNKGFHDTEMNKMLLKKYNGSIKRVVMDLISGDEKV